MASTATSVDLNATDGVQVLYMGHSFGRPFAERLDAFALRAGIANHETQIVFSGGESGSPGSLWASPEKRGQIQDLLRTGTIDVLVMICCSDEFVASNGASDQAIWDVAAYALAYNDATRIVLALPWVDFPADYADVARHRERSDGAYPAWERLAERLRADLPGADVVTTYHGAAIYALREMFEADRLPDVDRLIGDPATSLFRDQKGHAGRLAVDTGTLVWLADIYGIDPLLAPPFPAYDTDVRQVAHAVVTAPLGAASPR